MSPVVFLDLDGVMIDPANRSHGDKRFPGAVDRLLELCRSTGALLVVSSDRRCDGKGYILGLIGTELEEYLHHDWDTPAVGHRVDEIRTWLIRNGGVLSSEDPLSFVILDDFDGHFRNAHMEVRNRLVLCDSKEGFTDEKLEEAKRILSSPLALSSDNGKGSLSRPD